MSQEITRAYAEPVEALTLTRGEGTTRKIRGVASVYYDGSPGTTYQLAEGMVERIAPGAFDHLLQDDCIACVEHDGKLIVGRNKANLKLWSSARGLEYEIDLQNTTAANDLWENVQSGIIRGSSFKASLNMSSKDNVEWSRAGKEDVLTIKRFDSLKDVAMVSTPAYRASDVSAVRRSLEDHKMMQETMIRLARAQKLLGK